MAKKESKPKRKAKEPLKANHAGNVILHLSDLHFGRDKEQHQRKLVLELLLKELHDLEPEWKPTHLCITGDVADSGAPREYKKAASWLVEFLENFSISPEFVFICPGNHDVNWKVAKKYKIPNSIEKVDAILSIPLPTYIKRGFNNYCNFVKSVKIPPYLYKKVPSKESYLFGVRETSSNLRFVCCNSCFYSWDESSKGRLLLGYKLLDYMQAENLIGDSYGNDIITIAIAHHPKEKLDESEYYSSNQRPAAFNRLAEMSHLILMGHEHARINPWDRSGHGAYTSCIGSVFYSIDWENSFQLFRINRSTRRYECKYFQWNPSRRKWLEITDVETCWPFDRGISSQEVLNKKAIELADELWRLIKKQDFPTALQRYKAEQGWFYQNKTKIDATLAESLELYFQEINLWSN